MDVVNVTTIGSQKQQQYGYCAEKAYISLLLMITQVKFSKMVHKRTMLQQTQFDVTPNLFHHPNHVKRVQIMKNY